MIERYVKDCPEIVFELAEVSDSPLTIIYPGRQKSCRRCLRPNDNSIGSDFARMNFAAFS